MRISGICMKKFERLYFDTYSDAEIWLSNTTIENDGVIRKEGEATYYIFAKPRETELPENTTN
jgi:hypothetical protein